MNRLFEFFKHDTILSTGNPFFKSAEKTHRLFAGAIDSTARMQLAFGEELLDLNKNQIEKNDFCRSHGVK